METGKICSFTSHLRDMQNILATAVIVSEGAGKLINPAVATSRLNLGFACHSLHILVFLGSNLSEIWYEYCIQLC